jgi:hypothetical protein
MLTGRAPFGIAHNDVVEQLALRKLPGADYILKLLKDRLRLVKLTNTIN